MSKVRKIRWDRVIALALTPIAVTTIGVKSMTKSATEIAEFGETFTESERIVCDEETYTNLGEFRISYYCGCEKCNGKYAGVTASGKKLEEGMIATDSMFPYGTELWINTDGVMQKYTVEDRGSAIKGNKIDIYVSDHDIAKQLGIIYTDVLVKE